MKLQAALVAFVTALTISPAWAGALFLHGQGGVIPAGVVAAGLQAQYGLQFTAGRALTLTHHISTDLTAFQASCPGSSITNGDQLHLGSSCTVSNWDFTGVGVYIDGGKSLVCSSDCKFKNVTGDTQLVLLGDAAGAPGSGDTFFCTKCEFDGQSSQTDQNGNFGLIRNYGTVVLDQYWMHDAPSNNVLMVGTSLTLTNGYMQCPGKRGAGAPSNSTQHVDNMHLVNGVIIVQDVFFDNYDCAGVNIYGDWTSPAFSVQSISNAGYGTVTLSADRIIARGGAGILGSVSGLGAAYIYSYDAKPGAALVTVSITNSALETGTTDKYGPALSTNTTASYSGNFNYASGSAASLPSGP